MSVPRAGSSAVRGGDLPCKGGELSLSHSLLKFPPEPGERKSLSCYRKQASSSQFRSLYKGNKCWHLQLQSPIQSQSDLSGKPQPECRGSPTAHGHTEPTLNQRCQSPQPRALAYKPALRQAAPQQTCAAHTSSLLGEPQGTDVPVVAQQPGRYCSLHCCPKGCGTQFSTQWSASPRRRPASSRGNLSPLGQDAPAAECCLEAPGQHLCVASSLTDRGLSPRCEQDVVVGSVNPESCPRAGTHTHTHTPALLLGGLR